MPVTARRLIRKMRGGAQSHLLEADDGHFYVTKFRNNPQHRRILINEVIASTLLAHLQIACPPYSLVALNSQFVAENQGLYVQLGTRQDAVPPGWHFGSRYPGDPSRTAVYDFVPDTLLDRVANASDFLGVLAFDKWTGNSDARQSIFIRARLREYAPAYADHPLQVGFITLMIDHGYIFNGPHWEFVDAPLAGLYFRPHVYRGVTGLNDFEPWLARISNLPEEIIDDALRQIPPEWLNGDTLALDLLLTRLMKRRGSVADLIEQSIRARPELFPNWPSSGH
ncbi:MAG TPA: HipA family kinase [Bryobacteraceae bacterium]|nr:HipA family kinase [Bryobacteraceae bacterium]